MLAREVNGKPLVYLDSTATSQKPRQMIERLSEIYSHKYARVEEGHTLSQEATKFFEGTRAKVAKLINAAAPREIVFCRGATEALNLVSRCFEQDSLSASTTSSRSPSRISTRRASRPSARSKRRALT